MSELALVDADAVNEAVAKIQAIADAVGTTTVLRYLMAQSYQVNEDRSQSKQQVVLELANADFWLGQVDMQAIPVPWIRLLRGHSKMLVIVMDLMWRANNLGQVNRLDVTKLAAYHKIRPESYYACLNNLVGLGIVTYRHPGTYKLYLNITLHPIPLDVPPEEADAIITTDELAKFRAEAAKEFGPAVEHALDKEIELENVA